MWDLLIRSTGSPLAFRIIVQPAMAALLAIRTGLREARAGCSLLRGTIATDQARRRNLIREGWKDVAILFAAAVIIDLVYALVVFL